MFKIVTKEKLFNMEFQKELLEERVQSYEKEFGFIREHTPQNYWSKIMNSLHEVQFSDTCTEIFGQIESLESDSLMDVSHQLLNRIILRQRGLLDFSLNDISSYNHWNRDVAVMWILADTMHNVPGALNKDRWNDRDTDWLTLVLKGFIKDCFVLCEVLSQYYIGTEHFDILRESEIVELVVTAYEKNN